MSKYMLLGILFGFLSLTSLIVQAVETYESGVYTASQVGLPTVNENASEVKIAFQSLGALFRLLTFQVGGIPDVMTILIFWPITIIVIYMLLDIIKDLVPFT